MSDHCYFCGNSSKEFIHTGRFGCEYCPDFLSMIPEVEYALQRSNPWNKSNLKHKHPIRIGAQPIQTFAWAEQSEDLYFVSRYRIARNIRKTFFLNRKFDLDFILDFLNSYFPRLKKIDKKGNIEYWSCWEETEELRISFLIGDEDQIRWEICRRGNAAGQNWMENIDFNRKKQLVQFMGNRELFSFHKNWGFLNSCPTNCGRGDRFSVIFQKSKPVGWNCDFSEDWILEGDGIRLSILDLGQKEEKRRISMKNFNKRRKFYFQQSLVPLIFKDSGLMEVPKLSSNI